MSAIAEPMPHAIHDDALARRNAMVLAVAQALAGGNNTVIISTASIVGAVLAPDKGLATLPITCMVLGMWLGTLPIGWLARRFGRRFALQMRLGVRRAVRPDLLCRGDDRLVLAAAARHLLRRALCRRASVLSLRRRRYRERSLPAEGVSWVLAGGVFAALIGPQLVIFTKDLLPPLSVRRELSRRSRPAR